MEIIGMGRRVLRKSEVLVKTGLSDSTILRLEKKGMFPRRFNLALASPRWDESDVDNWLDERKNAETPRRSEQEKIIDKAMQPKVSA